MTEANRVEGPPLKQRDRLFVAIPIAIMLAVAAMQIVRAKAGVLAPDKGGAFGMFATVDQLPNRFIRLVVIDPAGLERPAPPRPEYQLDDYVYATLANPSDDRLAHIGRRVAEVYRDRGVNLSAVRVEVWRVSFDPATRTLERRPMKSLTVEHAT